MTIRNSQFSIPHSLRLGVNIDHVATVRQARYRTLRTVLPRAEPNLVDAARAVEKAGAHGITLHLREDRRHIQDSDLWAIKRVCHLPMNLEMSNNAEILKIALKVQPAEVCLVPERREEVTTEGGLNVRQGGKRLLKCIELLRKKKIVVSLFIAPDPIQIRTAAQTGAEFLELHTGAFAEARNAKRRQVELRRLRSAIELAVSLGLRINAGHGIRYNNIHHILKLPNLETLNIGHSIVSRAMMVGLEQAVKEMLQKMNGCDGPRSAVGFGEARA